MLLSYFSNFSSVHPLPISLDAVVQVIRSDKRLAEITDKYRATSYKSVKMDSPLFGVAALFKDGKADADITDVTGLSMVDIDHVEPELLPDLRRRAESDPHTLLSYLTISGEGLRIIFAYMVDPALTLDDHRQFYPKVFAAGNAYYADLLGAATDGKCKNISRLSALAHDADAYFNPDAEPFARTDIESRWQAIDGRRKAEASTRRELQRLQHTYDTVIRPEVEAEGAVYGPGTHNDYVMRVGYRLNQFGFSQAAAVRWAASAFPEYEDAVTVVESCYQKTDEFGTRRRLHRSSAARPPDDAPSAWASVEAIRQFLDSRIRLRYNEITARVEWSELSIVNCPLSIAYQPLTDRIVNSLWSEMSATQRVNIQDMYRVIGSDYVPSFHPFRSYLEGLPQWEPPEGGSAIDALAATVTVRGGDEAQQRFAAYLRKWLVGMVAGWLDTTVVNNVILVLIGEQGAYKTTWFNYLLPPPLRPYFYTKTNANRMTRDDLLTLSFAEDIGDGDHTTLCCIPADAIGRQQLLVKEEGILAGVEIARKVFQKFDPTLEMEVFIEDGAHVKPGDIAFIVTGKEQSLLQTERLMLNIMQRMSGIATQTRKYVKLLEGTNTRVLDTRKTTPGLRMLEKAAVKIGGGVNHRIGLFDMILLKDNHVDFAGGISNAIDRCHKYLEEKGMKLKIEIEVRNFDEIKQVMDKGGIDRIMLDNFSVEDTRKAVIMIDGKYETESSGGITLDTIRNYAECGVDYVSVGALTHSVKGLDMSFKAC